MKKLLKNRLFLTFIIAALSIFSGYLQFQLSNLEDSNIVPVTTPTEMVIKIDSSKVELDTIQTAKKILENIKKEKPKWGTIFFKDDHNKWVDIKGEIDFPYGQRKITYINKYKIKTFRKYIGIGYELNKDNKFYISGDIYYKRIGIGATVKADGQYTLFTKFAF